jgi:hypothetical protein
MEPRAVTTEQEGDVSELLEEHKQANMDSGSEDHDDCIASSEDEAVVDDSSDEEAKK